MIVVDTSAVIAILWEEVGSSRFVSVVESGEPLVMAAPNALELYLVATGRFNPEAGQRAIQWLAELDINISPFTAVLLSIATEASRRFGKGRHKAALNFGDCMAYALAKALDAPLLYKGEDFALTDIRPAI